MPAYDIYEQRWANVTLLTTSLPLLVKFNSRATASVRLPNKNSSELSLPSFATAPFAVLKKSFWCCFTDV